MTSKERIQASLNHKQPDKMPVDFGSTAVTGIHVLSIQKLRKIYGLEDRPVIVNEPYQMLGEIEKDLADVMGIDTIGIMPRNNIFGFPNNNGHKEFTTFWGQKVLVPQDFNYEYDEKGDLFIFPKGDKTASASGKMPKASYFFDTIIRQEPIDEAKLNIEDNMEEFEPISDEDLSYFKSEIQKYENSDKGIIANFGGTALGDIALVPAPFLTHPKGIRDISEWYMSTMMRPDYVREIFERETAIAVENLKKVFAIVGNKIDAVFICGTDFGTQDSTFCAPELFDDLWLPYYRKMNDWIHQNTNWKTFKHSCGAVENFMDHFIEAGFDIINPVQVNAKGMDPELLKNKYGDKLTFWGGGVDTQKVLSFGKPGDVTRQVLALCEVFSKNGGFVFNTVHNVQANVPIENLEAMMNAIRKFNGE
jgi:uroporphyrinogen-III decarboxylase